MLKGSFQPTPPDLSFGATYRLRLVNITTSNPPIMVRLMDGAQPLTWRAVAKEGADLPPQQATVRPAEQLIAVGRPAQTAMPQARGHFLSGE